KLKKHLLALQSQTMTLQHSAKAITKIVELCDSKKPEVARRAAMTILKLSHLDSPPDLFPLDDDFLFDDEEDNPKKKTRKAKNRTPAASGSVGPTAPPATTPPQSPNITATTDITNTTKFTLTTPAPPPYAKTLQSLYPLANLLILILIFIFTLRPTRIAAPTPIAAQPINYQLPLTNDPSPPSSFTIHNSSFSHPSQLNPHPTSPLIRDSLTRSPRMIKTRFAPSPTGFLHVGGARTALYSWLYAHHARKAGKDAKFVLRIEDTDQIRSTAESAAGILADLQWLGLNWDEGPTVGGAKNDYFQSMRLDLYNKHLNELLEKGLAYEAYESPAQLAALRQAAEKEKRPFRYRKDMPGRQLTPQPDVKPVLRFAMPYKDITVHDLILGPVTVTAPEHDDIVIRKSDGFPTYHFAVVIDDHYMGITHVLRAQEHLMNTFKHLGLYEALGWTPPEHAHLPLVFNMDNSKMSKREKAKVTRAAIQQAGTKDFTDLAEKSGVPLKDIQDFMAKKTDAVEIAVKLATVTKTPLPEIDVQDFRRSGYLPEALLNFIALVGWAPGQDREILTMDQMIDLFSLDGIQKTNARFDRKKLAWMNGEYIRKATLDRLADAVESFNQVTNYPIKTAPRETIKELLAMYQERMVTIAEMAENARFFFEDPTIDPKALEKFVKNNNGIDFLKQSKSILHSVQDWSKTSLAEPMDKILALGVEAGGKRGAAAQPLRVALSGNTITPPMLETIALLGREKTLARIDKLLQSVGG
ncbi:MAG TPA: glutamate--tRNA ligase family protein, partial [Phycisphaerae bacterium]|nr:glutamate--tRNA ligase family protein [Phycisphaerae bacterium]